MLPRLALALALALDLACAFFVFNRSSFLAISSLIRFFNSNIICCRCCSFSSAVCSMCLDSFWMTSLIWSFFMPFRRMDRAHMRFRATVQSSTPGVGTPGSQFLQQLSTPGMSMPGRHFGSGLQPFHGFCFFVSTSLVPNSVCWTFCFTKHVSAQHVSTPGTVPPGMHSGVVSQAALSGQHVFFPRSGTPGWQDGFASQLPGVPS